MLLRHSRILPLVFLSLVIYAEGVQAQPVRTVDLLNVPGSGSELFRGYGHTGSGSFGVPVAGPLDCDGDGLADLAFSAMTANSAGIPRDAEGEVYFIFGTGSLAGEVDTAVVQNRVITIIGDQPGENAGSEIWIDDVTGDGLGDLLIARQDYTPTAGRDGAGALTILVGDADLVAFAALQQPFDLAAPPASIAVTTLLGATDRDRFGIWMRTGDVTGDGIADILIGADQATENGENHRGEVWLVRGGSHLNATQTVDLANFATTGTSLAGNLLRIVPPAGTDEHHFGATVSLGDLDANDRDELLIAATLNRAGASLSLEISGAHATSALGSPDGLMYIVWDDNVPTTAWANGLTLALDAPPGTLTTIFGGAKNRNFGEELLGGPDFDGDGNADLYVGDLTGDGTAAQNRPFSGMGHVLFHAATLASAGTFTLDSRPPGLEIATFIGAEGSDIAGDTVLSGDFDGDGIADLALIAPHASPAGPPVRTDAGIVYVIHGQSQPWPQLSDLLPANFPSPSALKITQIDGAKGQVVGDQGDVLGYSAAAGDANGDGRDDLVLNEMTGNGAGPGGGGTPKDVGNLLVLSGFLVGPPGVPALPTIGLIAIAAALIGTAGWNRRGRRDRIARPARPRAPR